MGFALMCGTVYEVSPDAEESHTKLGKKIFDTRLDALHAALKEAEDKRNLAQSQFNDLRKCVSEEEELACLAKTRDALLRIIEAGQRQHQILTSIHILLGACLASE